MLLFSTCLSYCPHFVLFQYAYKGLDRASLTVHQYDPDGVVIREETQRDETKLYVDGCYISAPEAIFRLMGWPTH
jgi:hypothetical protein